MTKLNTLLFTVLMLLTGTAHSTTYYVDAKGGNDANNGTSTATPWKTIAKVNSTSFSPGDKVSFKKGEVWREQLTVPSSGSLGSPITFNAYGSGANPIITGSDLASTGWTSHATNVWKKTVTTQPNVVYFNNVRGTLETSIVNITAQYEWYWTANTLYVYAPNNVDPSTTYLLPGIEYGQRNHAVLTNNKSHIVISDLTLRDGNAATNFLGTVTFGTTYADYITISNCVIERGRQTGIFIQGPNSASNILISGCTIQHNGGIGIGTMNFVTGAARITGNTITTNGWAATPGDGTPGGIQGPLGGFEIDHNTITNQTPDPYAYSDIHFHGIYAKPASATPVIIHDNLIYGNTNGAGIKCQSAGTIYNNIIHSNGLQSISAGWDFSMNIAITIYGNTFYGGIAEYGHIALWNNYQTHTLTANIYNNTFYKGNGAYSNTGLVGAGTDLRGSVTIKNNIFYSKSNTACMNFPTQTGAMNINYNLYWQDAQSGQPNNEYNGVTYTTLAKWQALGHDANSVNANPLLTNPPSSMVLQAGSPAINAGTNVGLPYNGSAPDIGAYEYNGSTTNSLPAANAGPDQNILLPASSATLQGTGSDPDGSIQSYNWTMVSGPVAAIIATPSAATTNISGLTTAGTFIFRFTVTDNAGAKATDDINVIVNAPANKSPIANAGVDQTITLPLNTVTLSGSNSSDPDGTIATYSWSQVGGPGTANFTNSNTVNASVNGLVQGTYTFRLTVTDNGGANSTDDVMVVVNAATPIPPVANAGSDQSITLPTNYSTLDGSGSSDSDGSISSYAWIQVSGPSTARLTGASTVRVSVNDLIEGSYVFRLTVTDNSGAKASDDVAVTVSAAPVSTPAPIPNNPPVARAGSDQSITLPVNTATLDGSASTDTDGTISSYAWSQVSGPSAAALTAANTSKASANNLVEGSYTFKLTVTDNAGASASDNIVVTVNAAPTPPSAPAPNIIPIAVAGQDQTITLPVNSVTLDGSGSNDPDGSIASYAWLQISGPSTATLSGANKIRMTAGNMIQGIYTFRLLVTDNVGAQGSDEVQITVNAATLAGPTPTNALPTANAGSAQTITLPLNTVTLTGSGTDPDGTISSYKWSKISGPANEIIQSPGTAITNVDGLIQGVYVFRLTVTDNAGATASNDVQVTVQEALVSSNLAPEANAGTEINVVLPTNSVVLDGRASKDPDGLIVSWTWKKIEGPASYSINAPNAATTTVSGLNKGFYVFELTVTDNFGAKGISKVKVNVKKNNKKPLAITTDTVTVVTPAYNTILSGTESYDPDGTIVEQKWTFKKGPNSPKILSSDSARTFVVDLVEGIYEFEFTVKDDDGDIASKTTVVRVISKINIRTKPLVKLYPNPAYSVTNLSIETELNGRANITIYDVNGRAVHQEIIMKEHEKINTPINLSYLTKGTYYLSIQLDKAEPVIQKIIKL